MPLSRASSSFRSVTEHQRNGSTCVAASAITRRRPHSRQRAARMPKDGRRGDAEGRAAAIWPFWPSQAARQRTIADARRRKRRASARLAGPRRATSQTARRAVVTSRVLAPHRSRELRFSWLLPQLSGRRPSRSRCNYYRDCFIDLRGTQAPVSAEIWATWPETCLEPSSIAKKMS